METVIQTYNLTKTYNCYNAVDNVSMNINQGDIYGFIGLNGAGKTTLMRVLTGLAYKTSGGFSLFGTKDDDEKGIAHQRKKISSIVETPSLYLNMSAKDNIQVYTTMLGVQEDIPAILRFVGLDPNSKNKVKTFSLGMKQRLSIGMAICGKPEILILDEPINGLDPEGIVQTRELISKMNKDLGTTVLISSHILSELSKLATCYGFIHNGKLVKEISADEVENACSKKTLLTLSNVGDAIPLFPNAKLINQDKIIVDGEYKVSDVMEKLNSIDSKLLDITHISSDLEDYFAQLIGGIK